MKRPWHIWMVFGLCLAAVFAAMGWLTVQTLRLERAEGEARRVAQVEENVRLSLWRMDSAIGPVLAAESARPYFAWSAFYPAQRAYNNMFAPFEAGEVYVPSPLLTFKSPYVRVHFQVSPNGRVTSPQVPTGNMRDNADGPYVTGEEIDRAASKLAELDGTLSRDVLLGRLPRESELPVPALQDVPGEQGGPQFSVRQQLERSLQEQVARNRGNVYQQNYQTMTNAESVESLDFDDKLLKGESKSADGRGSRAVSEGAMKPVWMGDRLLLARRVGVNGDCYLQGCELDWPAIRTWLLGEVRDLLPEARLEPLPDAPPGGETHLLASIPAKLLPGNVPVAGVRTLSPMVLTLAIAWVCLLLVAFAVGTLLAGTMKLSERRATFVSAVTHELRTPITTLRMYSEMLDEGMVDDDAKRGEYVKTLRGETERLGHLVENVLGYSRLERGRHVKHMETLTAGHMLERIGERLSMRARNAGMTLKVETSPEAAQVSLRTDVSAVEQILFNLVDNACKYACGAADKRIRLAVSRDDGRVAIEVVDHGPGVSPEMRRRLFSPFSKSASEAAHSAPGIGMGLALSRRLARDLGGELQYLPTDSAGARFVLSLKTDH